MENKPSVPVYLKVGEGSAEQIGEIVMFDEDSAEDMSLGDAIVAGIRAGMTQIPGLLRQTADDWEAQLPEKLAAMGIPEPEKDADS